jgi:hypothetical protein
MQNPRTLLPICLMALLACFAPSVVADDLFSAETLVNDEGSETRNAALSELLAEVLVRVSGNPGIRGQAGARKVLDAAPSLVQQYRYRTADEGGALARYLWARFDRAGVERMMRGQQLPVWVQRPGVLMWVATERAGQREMLNFDNLPEARGAVLQQARQRGMPLQLPLMDLQDQAQLTPADVWSDYHAAIRQASARYPHDLVLSGRLRARTDGKWSGEWTLIGSDSAQSFQTPPQALPGALAFAVDQAQNLLASRYAPMPGADRGRGYRVSFSGVGNLGAYGRLLAILEDLETADGLALRHVAGDRCLFEFRLRGSEQDLLRALDGDVQLAAESGPAGSMPRDAVPVNGGAVQAAQPEADVHYRLLY